MSFPLPLRIVKKLPIRNSWEVLNKKLPIPLPILYYVELIREALANTLYQGFPNMPFVKCLSGFAEVPYQVPPWSLPDAPRMPKNKSKEAYLVPAPKARLYRKVLVAKCLPGGAEGPHQGQSLSPRKSFKNVLGTRLEGTFECKARLENADIYHPSQNHYTHEITSLTFELFRGLQLQLSGVFRIDRHRQLQFPCSSSRMQLQERIPLRNSQEFSAITIAWFNGFQI